MLLRKSHTKTSVAPYPLRWRGVPSAGRNGGGYTGRVAILVDVVVHCSDLSGTRYKALTVKPTPVLSCGQNCTSEEGMGHIQSNYKTLDDDYIRRMLYF